MEIWFFEISRLGKKLRKLGQKWQNVTIFHEFFEKILFRVFYTLMYCYSTREHVLKENLFSFKAFQVAFAKKRVVKYAKFCILQQRCIWKKCKFRKFWLIKDVIFCDFETGKQMELPLWFLMRFEKSYILLEKRDNVSISMWKD